MILLTKGLNQRTIANKPGRNVSTISRELKRNRDLRSGEYRSVLANRKSSNRRSSINKSKVLSQDHISYIEAKLKDGWSSQQITQRHKLEHGTGFISHESLYQYIHKRALHLAQQLVRAGKKGRKEIFIPQNMTQEYLTDEVSTIDLKKWPYDRQLVIGKLILLYQGKVSLAYLY